MNNFSFLKKDDAVLLEDVPSQAFDFQMVYKTRADGEVSNRPLFSVRSGDPSSR